MTEVVTFGCRLNLYESEVMRRHALATGLEDAVIVNTCAVTAEAERQALQAIRRLRRERPGAKIIVTGCAVQIDRQKFSAMPEIDHLIANDKKLEWGSFEKIMRHPRESGDPAPAASAADKTHVGVIAPVRDSRLRGNDAEKIVPTFDGLQRAFVEVQNGCDHRCTFCIIPYGRGASRSLPVGAIAEQVRGLAAQGYREIVLTGVDIASYGGDLPGRPALGQMIRRVLALVPELPRLRLSSLDPACMDDDLWRLIAEEPRFMPHLHLSVQAGDDMVLKRMKRRHLRGDVIALSKRARALRPDIAFGADFIAGFPTETEEMFENTLRLVEEVGLTWLHVFPYSARKGTPAAKMPQVRGEIRRERAATLRALGEKKAVEHIGALAGKKFDVLVEQNGFGCTRQFAKVKLAGEMPVGEIVEVEGFRSGENIMARAA